jgi:hypothetical protein
MPDHPILRKLRVSIVPYQISAQRLRRSPVYVAHTVHSYLTDITAALLGVGVTHPIIQRIAGQPASAPFPWLPPLGFAVLAAWVVLKVYVAQTEGARIAPLRLSCWREFLRIGRQVNAAIALPDPMPRLEEIQAAIEAVVDRHIAEGAWPWQGPAPDVDELVAAAIERIKNSFEEQWLQPPSGPQGR